MQVPLQVSYVGLERSDALESRIRESAAKLDQFHPRIMSCRVTVAGRDRHKRQGREFEVRVEAHAPGREAAVSTLKHAEDVYVAVRDAFEAVRRQLEARG